MPEMQQRSRARGSITSPNGDPHVPSSLPPWVHANESLETQEQPLIRPSRSLPNTRHYRPSPTHYKPGRKWDHLRSAEPPFLSAPIAEEQARWKTFMQAGPNPQIDEGRVVDEAWMQENMPDMLPGWRPEQEEDEESKGLSAKGLMYRGKWLISPERQERTVRFFWRILLKNAYMPMLFRLTVLAFSIAGLAIAANLYANIDHVNTDADPSNQCAKRASTYMAIAVGSVAIPYICYVTWDEYMSKPLGLRSVAAKTILLLCDLYFICFASSNVSLAFDTLYDHRWACYDEHLAVVGNESRIVQATCPDNASICYKQRALSGVLVVSLIAWCVTFSISVLRVVEKLRPD